MLLPKRVKHRKWHKPRHRASGIASRNNALAFGAYGLMTEDFGWVTSRQLEAARRVLTRYVRRGGKIWTRVFPDRPVTKKGNEVPMGGGKGSPDHYVATVKPGTVLLEMDGILEKDAHEALVLAGHKLPVHGKFIKKD